MNAFEILTGVGTLYVAPVNTAMPAVNAVPKPDALGWPQAAAFGLRRPRGPLPGALAPGLLAAARGDW